MGGKNIDVQFKAGDLVYYRGFNIFPPEDGAGWHREHMGIIVHVPKGMPHAVSYVIYWFDSMLTTRMHCDMIEAVYETNHLSEE